MSKITPCLWFDGNAEEAARFYVSLLPDSHIGAISHYTSEMPGGKPGDVLTVEFTLAGQSYMGLNGGPHFEFTPAISFSVDCEDQTEVDRLWNLLLDGGKPMQCGWITDRYGVSWQIIPRQLPRLLKDKDPAKSRRVMEAMLKMVKIEVDDLQKAYNAA